MSKADKLRAELELAEAEEAFIKKKATKGGVTNDDRHALRALRQEYRTKWRTPTSSGAQAPAVGAKGTP